jgi:hypothetical protein
MTDRNKTLSYRRAQFIVDGTETLESLLTSAHNLLPNIENRTIEDNGQVVLECRDFLNKPGSGVFIHIAAYTPGEQASVVPRTSGVSSGQLQTTDPPDGCEFMDGDTTIFVSADHVILCSSSLHEKQAERYMIRIIDKAGLPPQASQFAITRVANADKIKMIQKQGVKSINLNSSLYSATLDYIERTTVSKKLASGIAEQLIAIFKKDDVDTDLENAENLSVSLKLSFDSRKKGASFSRERLETLANQLVTENDDGFTISTLSGESIKSDDIILRKKVTLQRFGKSVYCADAWAELETYFYELKTGGLLEQ